MKLLILGRGRTCSTAIGNSLAHKYNLKFLGESYFSVHENLLKYYKMRPNCTFATKFNDFTKKIENHTKFLFSHEKMMCKIFPSVLIYPPSASFESETFDDLKRRYIFDLNILNLKGYDQIYFLDRDFYTSAISWVYSNKSKMYHRQKTNSQKYPVITIESSDFAVARFYIIEYLLQQKIKTYLFENNLPTIFIDETNSNEYINKSYLHTTTTDRNYDNLIKNVDEFKNFIDKWYPICEKETKDWNFY